MQFEKDPFNIYHITGRIYLFLFDEAFDLGMHFLRYQEFYESPTFCNKTFTLVEFIEWYSKEYGKGVFTYPIDWAGFNIPASVIWQVHARGISDRNKYDAAMLAAFNRISSTTHLFADAAQYDSFYILGACKSDIGVLGHELAHGLYATQKAYRDEMTSCFNKLPRTVKQGVRKCLLGLGYNDNVFADELQAYFSTGLMPSLSKYAKYTKPFKTVFEKHTKNIVFDVNAAKPLQFK